MAIRISTKAVLENQVSALESAILRMRRELRERERELTVLKRAVHRLTDRPTPHDQTRPHQLSLWAKCLSLTVRKRPSVARAARTILRENGRSLSATEIRFASHKAGRMEVKNQSL